MLLCVPTISTRKPPENVNIPRLLLLCVGLRVDGEGEEGVEHAFFRPVFFTPRVVCYPPVCAALCCLLPSCLCISRAWNGIHPYQAVLVERLVSHIESEAETKGPEEEEEPAQVHIQRILLLETHCFYRAPGASAPPPPPRLFSPRDSLKEVEGLLPTDFVDTPVKDKRAL